MSNQPQASVRKSTTWPLPAGSLSAVETPHYHSSGAHNSRSGPRNLCLCVPMTPCVISAHRPALHPREGTSTQTTDSRPLDRLVLLLTFVFSVCGGFLFHSDDSAHLPGSHNDTIWRVGSLKLRCQCRTKMS